MPAILRKSVFFLLLFGTRCALADPEDSAQVKVPTIIHYTTTGTGITGALNFFRPDSLLDDLQVFNPAIRFFHNDLANAGSASDPKLFTRSGNCLTEFGNHSFSLYKWTPSSVKYYKTNKRYSNLHYHMSGGKEQQITITLAQNILRNWNAGIDFNRQASLGFLSNGKTFITNFNFFTWYHSPDQRYHLFGSATWNSIKNEVNGGLTTDSLYDQNNFSNNDLEGLKIALANAEHRSRNHIFSLTHYYDFIASKDSAGKKFPTMRLLHQSEYERSSYQYSDNQSDTSYYANNYFTDDIPDTLHYDQWIHRLSLQTFHSFPDFRPVSRAALEITAGSQWFDYAQLIDTTLRNIFAEGRIRTAGIRNRCTLDITGQYVLNGVNEKNRIFRLTFRYPLLWGAYMHIGLQDALQSPSLMQNFYQSDHFIWENDFEKISSRQFFFRISQDQYNFSIAGTSTYIGNYIYYDTLSVPVQSNDSIRVSQLFIKKDFRFWKFRFNNSAWIQETNSEEVRIPGFASRHSLFYENQFFKKKLAAQIGFDVHYTSAYFSNAYSPATSVYYTQNREKTNGYPLVDFFINLKIKSARIFFKLQNAGDNLVGNNYFNTLYYPMPGMVFQFGVNWRFFD